MDSMADKIVIKKIANWREFQEVVAGTEYKNWIFRGQSDSDWPLFSSLSRYFKDHGVHPRAWAIQEDRISRIFRRKAHLFLEHVPVETDDFQWLALMQHHGAPTRLLDFTFSPFIAAFFALEHATKDAAVWGVFMPATWRVPRIFPQQEQSLTYKELRLGNPGAYRDFYLYNDVPFVTNGEPFVMNKRLIAQSGTFVVPGVLDQPADQILSGYPDPEKTIVKFELSTHHLRDEAMLALYTMNITYATLFPDLDGLARSMAYELEFNLAINPKTLEVNPGHEA